MIYLIYFVVTNAESIKTHIMGQALYTIIVISIIVLSWKTFEFLVQPH